MNLRSRTKAISKFLLWHCLKKDKKEKLQKKIKQISYFKEGLAGDEKERSKLVCFEPEETPLGAYFITPGLHPLGIEHPQFQDMCLMLASLGYLVYAPYLVDYRNLFVRKSTLDEYKDFFDRSVLDVRERGHQFKFNVFSISFGTLMSLGLAADSKRQQDLNSVIIFGGFGSWKETCDHIVEKALFGKKENGYGDIRTLPAVFSHLLEFSDVLTEEASRNKVRKAWLAYIKETWMDEVYLDRSHCQTFAESLSKDMSLQEETFFMRSCGLEEGTFQLYEELLAKGEFSHLNPLAGAEKIKTAIYLIHGKHDRLIDVSQVKVIKKALPRNVLKRLVLTKLYAHSKRSEEGSALFRLFSTIPEIKNIFDLILTLSVPNPKPKRKPFGFKSQDKNDVLSS